MTTPTIQVIRERELPKFTGEDKSVTAKIWIKLFEQWTLKLTPDERVTELMTSLDKGALIWYGSVIAGENKTWDEVKRLFSERFEKTSASPLLEAQDRILRRDENVEKYFNDKLSLLRQTSLTDEEIIPLLTRGLPISWRLSITTAQTKTPNEWIRIAQQVESHYKTIQQRSNFPPRPRQTPIRPRPATFNTSQQTPKCRICEGLGRTAYHWHRDCPNNSYPRPRFNNSQNTPQQTTQRQNQNRQRQDRPPMTVYNALDGLPESEEQFQEVTDETTEELTLN